MTFRSSLQRTRPRGIALAGLCLTSALAGCSPPIAGTYTDTSGVTQYEFHPDGRVFISVLGATVSGSYEVNSERVLITAPQGTVLLIRGENSLQGPMGLELTRKTQQQENEP